MKKLICIALLLLMAFSFSFPVLAAQTPYTGYTYNNENNEQISPQLYMPNTVAKIDTQMQGNKYMLSDMFAFQSMLYVLDGAQSRILIYSPELILEKELYFKNENGEQMLFEQSGGLFVGEGGIYISDKKAQKLYRFSKSGSLLQALEKPTSPIYDSSISFCVSRIVADSAGNIYALVDGLYAGAVMFSQQGEFLGFYGPNRVEMTFDMLIDQSWKQLLSTEQKTAMTRFVPIAYTSLDIDAENFVYTCSKDALSESTRVRKLNPSGAGLWEKKKLSFGDIIPDNETVDGLVAQTQAIDLDIDENGFLNVLDGARGRVFQYNSQGELLGIFGAKGVSIGTFAEPIAIESINGMVYVLDAKGASITSFKRTEYGEAMAQAFIYYNDGSYESASEYWQTVLRSNCYSQPANVGMGKALFAMGEESEALKHFYLANDIQQYSDAFAKYRLSFMRTNFTWLVLAFVVLVALLALFIKMVKKREFKTLKYLKQHFHVMASPIAGLEALIYKKRLAYSFSCVILAAWLALDILKYFATGFIFNKNRPQDFNFLLSLTSTVVLYLLWVLVNWAVSTLSNGKGTAKIIFCASAYALLPYVISQAISLCLSSVLTIEEGVFITWINAAGLLWAVLLIISAVMTVHHYTLGKAVRNIALTVCGIAILIFLLFMAVVLFEHVANLIMIIYNEITLRR